MIQVATLIAEEAEEGVGKETEAEAVIMEVVAGVLQIPSLPTISVNL